MAEIIAINGATATKPDGTAVEVDQGLIRELEEALDLARKGAYVGAAMVFQDTQYEAQWRLTGSVGGFGMIGALETLKMQLVNDTLREQVREI